MQVHRLFVQFLQFLSLVYNVSTSIYQYRDSVRNMYKVCCTAMK